MMAAAEDVSSFGGVTAANAVRFSLLLGIRDGSLSRAEDRFPGKGNTKCDAYQGAGESRGHLEEKPSVLASARYSLTSSHTARNVRDGDLGIEKADSHRELIFSLRTSFGLDRLHKQAASTESTSTQRDSDLATSSELTIQALNIATPAPPSLASALPYFASTPPGLTPAPITFLSSH